MISFSTTFALFYPCVLIRAGIGDIGTMRIPNRLILLLLAGYLASAPLAGLKQSDVAGAVAAAGVVFALGLVAFTCRWMGGGDVKLMAAAALWLGAGNVPAFIFYTSVFGAVLTLLVLIFRSAHLPIALRQRAWISRLHQRDAGVPYGAAIAAAGILVYLKTPWAAALL